MTTILFLNYHFFYILLKEIKCKKDVYINIIKWRRRVAPADEKPAEVADEVKEVA
jgi:hypothetical protein